MSSSADSIAAVAERMRSERRARGRSVLVQLGVFVLLPTIIATIYFAFVASPQYSSVMLIAIRGGSSSADASQTEASELKDAKSVDKYIRSRDMLAKLDENGSFSRHYTDPDIDYFSRLSDTAGSETRFRYYSRSVDVQVDEVSGDLTIEVKAFGPTAAHDLAEQLLAATQKRVRQLHTKARKQAIEAAERDVKRARERLVAKQLEVGRLSANPVDGAISPPQQSESPELQAAKLEASIARTDYESAVADLSATRRASVAQRRYLEVIAPPSSPTEPSGPLRLRTIVTAFLVSLAIYAIGSLLLASVREHARL